MSDDFEISDVSFTPDETVHVHEEGAKEKAPLRVATGTAASAT